MNHAVGDGHYENRIKPEPPADTVQHEAAEEEFERKELQEIKQLPEVKIRIEAFLCMKLVERVSFLETLRGAEEYHQGHHHHQHDHVQVIVPERSLPFEPVIRKGFFENKLDQKDREQKITNKDHEHPPGQVVQPRI